MASKNPWSAESITSSRARPRTWSPLKFGSAGSCSSRSSSRSSSSKSTYSRPITGDHLLDWYIPRYIAGSAAATGRRQQQQYSRGTQQQSGDVTKPSSPHAKKEVIVPSPLHNSSKQEWISHYTDERVRSLPIPFPRKPKVLEFPVTRANNLQDIFGRNSQTGSHLLYSRYGVPLVPLAIVPQYQIPWTNYNMWNPNVYSDNDAPPPQSIFKQVGVAQRRDFTVAPEWRRIRHNQ